MPPATLALAQPGHAARMQLTVLFPSVQQAEDALRALHQAGQPFSMSVLGTAEPLNGATPVIEPLERELEAPPNPAAALEPTPFPREATDPPGTVLVSLEGGGDTPDEAALQQVLARHGGQIHQGVRGDG